MMWMCLMEIGRESRIMLIVFMNGRVGNSEVEGVVGKWGHGWSGSEW